jgi:hypothetical protein
MDVYAVFLWLRTSDSQASCHSNFSESSFHKYYRFLEHLNSYWLYKNVRIIFHFIILNIIKFMLFCVLYSCPYRAVSCLSQSVRYVTFRSWTLLIHKDRSMILAATHVRFCSLGGITTLRTRRVVQTKRETADDKEVVSARDAQTWFSLFCSYQNWAAWAKVTRFASNIRWFCRLYTVLQTDTKRHS